MSEIKEIDYYGALNLHRCATPEQIVLAYRKNAIRCNPHRDPKDNRFLPPMLLYETDHLECIPKCSQWEYVNKAYDILSDPLRREIYDNHGEYGLLNGVDLPNGYFPPYKFSGNCFEIYNSVFGTYSPYGNLIDAVTNPPPLYSCKGIGVKTKGPDVTKVVYLELKEVFYGAMKRMQVLRQEFANDEESKTECREKVININIPPGTLPSTSFRYKEEGDRHPTRIPGDLVFVTSDKPHPVFTRDGPHLHMRKPIDLAQALCGFKFFVETIDGKKILIAISDVVYPGFVKEMLDEGLPVIHEPLQRGSLSIHFDITFPKYIPRHLKCKLKKLLDEVDRFNQE